MKKQYAWDQVDRLAEEWYATPAGEEHAAIKQKLLEEFLGLSCNLLSESMMEGLGDFWEQDFQRFDPALSPFSKFLLSRLKLRVRDGVREDLGLRRVKRDGETVTEGAFSLDDTGGKDADDDMTREVRDPRAEEALEELFLDERAYECLSLMLDLPNKLQGKANNPEKINYYRMFFTDGVTDYVRSSGGQVFFAHEADLFQAAKLPFLDFFLDRVCRTVPPPGQQRDQALWPAGGGPPGRARGAAPAPGRVSQLSGPGGGAQGGPVRHLPAADGLSGLFKEDAAMLTRYQLILEPDRPCAIGPEWGYRLYAALLSQTPEGFGAALHQNAVTPLSQFVWAEKTGALHWTVSLLGEISEEILSPLLEGVPSLYLERDRVELRVTAIRSDWVHDVDELFARAARQEGRHALRFQTPTAFKSRGQYVNLPTTRLLMQSLVQKWNGSFLDCPIEDEDGLGVETLAAGLRWRGFQLRDQSYRLKGSAIPGFVGRTVVENRLSGFHRQLADALLLFSGYSGVGIKTALGMGGVIHSAQP